MKNLFYQAHRTLSTGSGGSTTQGSNGSTFTFRETNVLPCQVTFIRPYPPPPPGANEPFQKIEKLKLNKVKWPVLTDLSSSASRLYMIIQSWIYENTKTQPQRSLLLRLCVIKALPPWLPVPERVVAEWPQETGRGPTRDRPGPHRRQAPAPQETGH